MEPLRSSLWMGRTWLGLILCWFAAINPGIAASQVSPPLETLADQATLVADVRVISVRSGFDPESRRIARYVEVEVEAGLYGVANGTRLVLRELGGWTPSAVNVVPEAPNYRAGEKVRVFLEATRDGALRTLAHSHGRLAVSPLDSTSGVEPSAAASSLRQRLETRHQVEARAIELNPGAVSATVWTPRPPEFSRLQWMARPNSGAYNQDLPFDAEVTRELNLDAPVREQPVHVDATTLEPGIFARWSETDNGESIPFRIQMSDAPTSDPSVARQAIQDAQVAWNEASDSRIEFQLSPEDYPFTTYFPASPATTYSASAGNIILFGDPYDDISPLTNCSGTLAIGGYWRTGSPVGSHDGQPYYRILQAYVIFNEGAECFLSDSDNLAEVATHELGHVLGFGHSTVSDAIMRSFAYGGRGARLGADDRDAAHCSYPHQLDLLGPTGGELWLGGSREPIQWNASPELGAAGSLRIEASYDGGNQWSAIATSEPNDGEYEWTLPNQTISDLRLRLTRQTETDSDRICTQAPSPGAASVASQLLNAGSVPATGPDSLRLDKLAGQPRLSWGSACGSGTSDYAIYRGSLDLLRMGFYNHESETCSTSSANGWSPDWASESRYYLVAPLSGAGEGRIGTDSSGQLRPQSGAACVSREPDSSCGP